MTQEQPRAGLDFGDAIRALKAGHRVSRAGWNGKDMWLILAASSIAAVREHGQEKHNRLIMQPHIVMKTAQAQYVPWLASQTDVLAEDWTDLDATAAPVAKRYTAADIANLKWEPMSRTMANPLGQGYELLATMKDGRLVNTTLTEWAVDHRRDLHSWCVERVLAVANGEAP